MLYMIIERFHPGSGKALYRRFEEKGRMMPDGLHYINSWIDEQVTTCFQVMETNEQEKIREWISKWNDLADFEVIPVITSAAAKETYCRAWMGKMPTGVIALLSVFWMLSMSMSIPVSVSSVKPVAWATA